MRKSAGPAQRLFSSTGLAAKTLYETLSAGKNSRSEAYHNPIATAVSGVNRREEERVGARGQQNENTWNWRLCTFLHKAMTLEAEPPPLVSDPRIVSRDK
jgi:hypothetical protein